jgi:hypothetical protein
VALTLMARSFSPTGTTLDSGSTAIPLGASNFSVTSSLVSGNVAVAGKKPAATLAAYLETIPVEPAPKKESLAATKVALGISRDSLDALTLEATKRGLIEIVIPTNRTSPHLISRSTKA